MKTYYVKGSWIFNLEAMHDKLHCIIYDMEDGNIQTPFEIAGTPINSEDDVYELRERAEQLEWIAKSRKVPGKEYGEIKRLVEWRVTQRYLSCLMGGMSEERAGRCFGDM